MLKNFRTFQLSVTFYRQVATVRAPAHLKDQLTRAAASISLNLAEGYGKSSPADRRRFYDIAMGSLRESQAALYLMTGASKELHAAADSLGAHIYRLMHPR